MSNHAKWPFVPSGGFAPAFAFGRLKMGGLGLSWIFALGLATATAFAQSGGGPIIQMQPVNQNAFAGGMATFTVTAAGASPLSYQWFKFNTAIAGANQATLKLTAVDLSDEGYYFVQVTNLVGTNRSIDVTLTVTRADFGDAPATYPTLLSSNGAWHALRPGFYLGAGASFEPDGQPDPGAALDNFDDGVAFLTAMVPGSMCNVRVVASANGLLSAWVDFNGTGNWSGSVDQIFADLPLVPGPNDLSFQVPTSVLPTAATFARFRFSSARNLGPAGPAPDGEVEDYRLPIYAAAADLCVGAEIAFSAASPANGQCTLVVTNIGPSPATSVMLSNRLSGVDILGIQPGSAGACVFQGDTILCNEGNMPAGDVRFVKFDFHVRQPSLITNTLTARSDVLDPNPPNNRSIVVARAAPPLVITAQPQSVRVLPGKDASFSVTAQGVGPLTYQWFANGAALDGATNPSLTLVNVRSPAEIRVVVTDSISSLPSDPAMLALALPSRILQQPQPVNAPHGVPVQFSAQVDGGGSPYLQYQWRLNGANIPGATNPVYEIPQLRRSDAGNYTLAVGNDGGVSNSDPAPLTCADIPIVNASDSFASRGQLALPGTDPYQGVLQTDNCQATTEPGEPSPAGQPGGASVWFQWTAPVDGTIAFDTIGSTFDTLLAVYEGTNLTQLREWGSDDDRGGYFRSFVQCNVTNGHTYSIAIHGFAGRCGVIVLAWNLEAQRFLPNIFLHPRSLSIQDPNEPVTLGINATSPDATTPLFYQWFFNGGQIQGATDSTLTIASTAKPALRVGTYKVRVSNDTASGRFVESRPVVLEFGPSRGIQSQDKAEAAVISFSNTSGSGGLQLRSLALALPGGGPPPFMSVAFGIPGTQVMNNTNSTADIDCFRISSATRWLGIQVTNDPAAAGSLLRVDSAGSEIPTELAVYRFIAPSCLQSVVCMHTNIMGCDTNSAGGSYSLLQFTPELGGLYLIFADGLSGAQGIIQMNWQLGAPPILDPPQPACAVMYNAGAAVSLSSGVTNNPAPRPDYQWYYYGMPLTGATNSTLVFAHIQPTNAGSYSIIISNAFGMATNGCCVIVDPPQLRYQASFTGSPWLLNISAALLPGCVLQAATNLSPVILWENVYTNTMTNCNCLYSAPIPNTNGSALPQRFYRARRP